MLFYGWNKSCSIEIYLVVCFSFFLHSLMTIFGNLLSHKHQRPSERHSLAVTIWIGDIVAVLSRNMKWNHRQKSKRKKKKCHSVNSFGLIVFDTCFRFVVWRPSERTRVNADKIRKNNYYATKAFQFTLAISRLSTFRMCFFIRCCGIWLKIYDLEPNIWNDECPNFRLVRNEGFHRKRKNLLISCASARRQIEIRCLINTIKNYLLSNRFSFRFEKGTQPKRNDDAHKIILTRRESISTDDNIHKTHHLHVLKESKRVLATTKEEQVILDRKIYIFSKNFL